jgi:hypothetical protein
VFVVDWVVDINFVLEENLKGSDSLAQVEQTVEDFGNDSWESV